MGIKFIKNHKNEKPKHIVFVCHITSIQVDKLIRFGHIEAIQIMYLPLTLNSVDLMKSSMKRSRFGFQTWKFQGHTSQKLHFRVTKKDPCLPFQFML
jgi:hypothetical protein